MRRAVNGNRRNKFTRKDDVKDSEHLSHQNRAAKERNTMFTSKDIVKTFEKQTGLFTVILLHYNQQCYLRESLDSIFKQEYDNIELIFADDCSTKLDIDAIRDYVEKNRKPNISNVIYQINDNNCGTVNNINRAVQSAHGTFCMFFAADDKLYDPHVLSNFSTCLSELPEDQYMVSGQCNMMDEDLSELIGAFVNVPLALELNRRSAKEQFQKFAFTCMYAMGATAFRMEMFQKFGYFDTTYRIIEDWSYFLHLTNSGSKIIYVDFQALLHRDGGVSHFNQVVLPPHVLEYKNDNLLIQEREILPYLSSFTVPEQVKLMNRYENDRKGFAELSTGQPRPGRIDLIKQNKKFFLRKAYWWMIDHTAHYKRRCIQWGKKLLPAWVLLRIIKIVGMKYVSPGHLNIVDTTFIDALTWIVMGLFLVDVLAFVCVNLFNVLFCLRRKKQELFSRNK